MPHINPNYELFIQLYRSNINHIRHLSTYKITCMPFLPYMVSFLTTYMAKKKQKPVIIEKKGLHPRNKHRNRYDFPQLIETCPELAPFVFINKYNEQSIDFSDANAVKMLNKALLMQFYGITYWDIPEKYLCPPIPNRADYIHYMADLLADCNEGIIPRGEKIHALDIGIGANCIYPIIGNREYGWQFVGSDIDSGALNTSLQIIANNDLEQAIQCRFQESSSAIFSNIIKPEEFFDVVVCNPPFHASLAELEVAVYRKWANLGREEQLRTPKPILNFGGKDSEVCCEGGESAFVRRMVEQSANIPTKCFWFSSLISKKTTLPDVYKALERVKALEVHTIDMSQGQKISRVIVWTFLDKTQQKEWRKKWQVDDKK